MQEHLFPVQSKEYILSFQFSFWYPLFFNHTIKSIIIRPLPDEFVDYLNADGVFVPEGSEDVHSYAQISNETDIDDPSDQDSDYGQSEKHYAFPHLDTQIRAAIEKYDAVFPKLNFSSPRDAAWILPPSAPLKCLSPADVYLLLKSSDFVTHDLNAESVFEGCAIQPSSVPPDPTQEYTLELVLRKWYLIDHGREMRCFVRGDRLLGGWISQRDPNYYAYLNDPTARVRITTTIQDFWEKNIKGKHQWRAKDYVFDFLLTRDLSRGHIIDFNPYASRTDPLLFSYEELRLLSEKPDPPELKLIDTRSHPAAVKNTPTHQHNMIPFDVLALSSGREIGEFADIWKHAVHESAQE